MQIVQNGIVMMSNTKNIYNSSGISGEFSSVQHEIINYWYFK